MSRVTAVLIAVMGWGVASAVPATAAGAPPAALDCATLPCGDVLPRAVRFEPVSGELHWAGYDADGGLVGWVALSTDFVDIKAYSGKPLVTLVGLDPEGIIPGAKVVHHSEPILLVGIPESALFEFVEYYAGKRATDRIVVGRATDPDTVAVDAISGATVTVLAQNHTILETARKLGVKVGVLDAAAAAPGRFVTEDEPWTFDEMVERGALGRLTVSEAEMGVGDSDRPFIDLYFGIADAPQIGRALMVEGDYDYYMRQLEDGEHLFVVLGRGSGSFKGSSFVRGGIFDRVRLTQSLREITFRDTDYYNLNDVPALGAPRFDEGAVFVARGGLLDPGAEYDLVFLGSRYDRRSAFSREFREFRASHRLPESVYRLEYSAEEAIWRQAWSNRRTDAIVLTIFLLFVIGVFSARSYTTADPARIKRLHRWAMIVSFLVVGVYMRSQPSVTQILTLIGSVADQWRWSLFLSEPLIFILWIFITFVALVWGRGVFCGWVCPYGALTELLFSITKKLGVRTYELPDAWHLKLRYLRYGVLFVLIPAYLWDSALGERLAEVEPFKSTFLVPAWQRPGPFFGWWIALLLVSTFMYRPFCRYLCPLGGGLALLGSFRVSGPRRRRFCSDCKICTRGCEPRAIRADGTIDSRECLSCMDCEATYRNPNACPPLLGIAELTNLDVLTSRQSRKLADLKVEAKDV